MISAHRIRVVAALLLCTVAAGFVRGADPQTAARESITAGDLRRHVAFFASDTLEGREAGTAGGRAAAAYLISESRRIGLKPAGEEGDFIQDFGRGYRNVLALLPGRDGGPEGELLLVGAHYDHVGYGRNGNSFGPVGLIHNGADDNASGVAAILELAEALAALPMPPRRGVLFAFWDAEEIDLLGSQHWLARPTVGVRRVRMAFNLDMVGRLRDDTLTVFGVRSAAGLRQVLAECNRATDLRLTFSRDLRRESDHYPFLQHAVPCLMLHTGKHEDYHRPSDVVERVNYEGLQRIATLLFETVVALAEREQLPPFRFECWQEARLAEASSPALPWRPRLGITWNSDRQPDEPVRIRTVDRGSAADRGGLRPGDVLVSLGGQETAHVAELRDLVATAPRRWEAVVLRDGHPEPLTLLLDLDGDPRPWGLATRRDPAEPDAEIVTTVYRGSQAERLDLRPGDRLLPRPSGAIVERDGRLRALQLAP